MDQFSPLLGTEDKLEDALDMLAAGFSLDAILTDAGDDAAWMRPLLEMAGNVNQLRHDIQLPPPDASLQRMLTHAKKIRPAAASPAKAGWWAGLVALFAGSANGPAFKMANLAASVAVAFLAVLLLGGGLAAASQNSLPGDTTYGIKRATEAVRLSLAFDAEQQARLADLFNQRRQTEAQALLDEGREASLGFDQFIDKIQDEIIWVDNLMVELEDYTVINGKLAPGALVHFEVVTHPPDGLHALVITVIEPAPALDTLPEPADEATAVPKPDVEAEPPATNTPEPPAEVINTTDPAANDNSNDKPAETTPKPEKSAAENSSGDTHTAVDDNTVGAPAASDPADDNINHNDGDLTGAPGSDDGFDDNSGDGFTDNSGDNSDDGFDNNSGDNSDDGFNDNSGDNSDDGFNDNSGDNSDDGFNDNSGDNSDDGFDDNGDDGFTDDSGDNLNDNGSDDDFNENQDDFEDDNSFDNSNDNSNDNTEDNSNDNTDDNSNDNTEDNSNDSSGNSGGNSGSGGGN